MAVMVAERMHAGDDGPSHMTVEQFEVAYRAVAAATDDTVRLEFIGGRIREKRMPDGDHNEIIMWLQGVCMQHKPGFGLYGEQGLKVEAYRNGRARPDGVLAPLRTFAGQGEWASPAGVLMTVEVTSHDRDTNARDRVEKPFAYAVAGIPLYLLIDREAGTATVFSDPDPHLGYRDQHMVAFGEKLDIPQPAGLVLDTEPLEAYVR